MRAHVHQMAELQLHPASCLIRRHIQLVRKAGCAVVCFPWCQGPEMWRRLTCEYMPFMPALEEKTQQRKNISRLSVAPP